MTIRYKNQGFKQTDTSKVTVLTCPTDGTIIVKSIYVTASDSTYINRNSQSNQFPNAHMPDHISLPCCPVTVQQLKFDHMPPIHYTKSNCLIRNFVYFLL